MNVHRLKFLTPVIGTLFLITIWASGVAFAESSGTIYMKVLDPDGQQLSDVDVPIRFSNGELVKTVTAQDGTATVIVPASVYAGGLRADSADGPRFFVDLATKSEEAKKGFSVPALGETLTLEYVVIQTSSFIGGACEDSYEPGDDTPAGATALVPGVPQTHTIGKEGASAVSYSISSTTCAYTSINTTGTPVGTGDETVHTVSIPWDVQFFGVGMGGGATQTSLKVSTNGWVGFGSQTSAQLVTDCFPSTSTPNGGIVGVFWDDMDVDTFDNPNAMIYFEVQGTAPNRVAIIEWFEISRWSGWCCGTFQVRFYEATGCIETRYDDVDFGNSLYDFGASASVGVENPAGTVGAQFSCNTTDLFSGLCVEFCPGIVNTCDADDVDWFTFDVTNCCTYVMETITGGDTYMELYDSAFNLLALDDDSGGGLGALISYTTEPGEAGTVYLGVIDSVGIPGTGGYDYDMLLTEDCDDPPTADAGDDILTCAGASPVVLDGSGSYNTLGYGFEVGNNALIDISGTGIALGLFDDDDADVALPFSFDFYGDTKTSIKVGSNGYLTFGTDGTDLSNTCLPNTNTFDPNDGIYVFWDDMYPGNCGGDVYYEVQGTAPNRMFIVQWHQVARYFSNCDGTFQAILYETSNEIEMRYADVTFGSATYDYGASATVGLENADGTEAIEFSCDSAVLADGMSILFTLGPQRWIIEGGAVYNVASGTCGFNDISGTGTPLGLSDDASADVALPFSFEFYGDAKASVKVASNGYLTFGTDGTDLSNDCIPDSFDPNDLIAVWWDDLDPGNAGPAEVYYEVQGTSPNRTFIVQWDQIDQFPDYGSITFEAILYETTNVIEFRYLDTIVEENTSDNNAAFATIGIENADGSDGEEWSCDSASVFDGDCISFTPTEIPDTDCLTFEWFDEDNNLVSTDEIANVVANVPLGGCTTFTLVVTDCCGFTGEDTVDVCSLGDLDLALIKYAWGPPGHPGWYYGAPLPGRAFYHRTMLAWIHARIENRGGYTADNVEAYLTDIPANMRLEPECSTYTYPGCGSASCPPWPACDPHVAFGTVTPGQKVWSTPDTFTIQLDLDTVIDPCITPTWTVEYDDPEACHHVLYPVPIFPVGEGPASAGCSGAFFGLGDTPSTNRPGLNNGTPGNFGKAINGRIG